MDLAGAGDIVLFDGFRFDRNGSGLSRADGSPVPLGSRALVILQVLIEQKGMSLAAIARATGHPRQLIKRRYESLKKRRPTGNQESAASIE